MENRYRREASMAAATRLLISSILPKRISAGLGESAIASLLRHLHPITRKTGARWGPRHCGRDSNGFHNLGRQSEADVLRHHLYLAHIGEALLRQKIDGFLDEDLGRRSAGRQTYGVHALQPLRLDGEVGLNEMRVLTQVASYFHQPVRIRAVVRAYHQQQVTLAGDVLYRGLAVFRRVA